LVRRLVTFTSLKLGHFPARLPVSSIDQISSFNLRSAHIETRERIKAELGELPATNFVLYYTTDQRYNRFGTYQELLEGQTRQRKYNVTFTFIIYVLLFISYQQKRDAV
jgi:hypothetical protein